MKLSTLPWTLLAGLVLASPATVSAQTAPPVHPSAGLADPLGTLIAPQAGKAISVSSMDPTGGNADMRAVEPGQTLTVLDTQGPGLIQRFWCTIAPRATEDIHSQAILRMYWDGETTPSVEAPIGAFFGIGFGQQVDYQSMPLNETSGGYNCYWPMPFHKSARWTLTNMSNRRIDAFYYNIQMTRYTNPDELPPDTRLFHAQWRRENPTTPGKNYTILEATGQGHFVGTALFMQPVRGRSLGYLEGDEMFYVDGETKPSISGTGTEDYFSSGWYYDRGPYSALFHGVPIKDTEKGRVSTYRWHIPDPVPFTKSIRITIEHGAVSDSVSDYSSVAYWYQTEPHAPFPAFPTDPKALMPTEPPPTPHFPGAVEAEKLVGSAKATEGDVTTQDMDAFDGTWSNAQQLWWFPAHPGAELTLQLPAPSAGTYDLTGYFTKAKDYGTIQVLQGGRAVGPQIDLYSPDVVPTGSVPLGRVTLNAGNNPIAIRLIGKDNRSAGSLVGIDAFTLKAAG